MVDIHPVLANILSLAEKATWQRSAALADEAVPAWLARAKPRDYAHAYLIGCGTSHFVAEVAQYALEHLANIPARSMQGFAFAQYAEPALLGPQSLVLAFSTGGESEAVCSGLARAKEAGAATLALTAYANSSVTRIADATILTGGDLDRVPCKTKSYVQSLISAYLLAIYLGQSRGVLSASEVSHWRSQFDLAAEGARLFLGNGQHQIEVLAERFAAAKPTMLGSGANAGMAGEAALKVIEMAKTYCEAGELEDFLHGRIREVNSAEPIFLVAPRGKASGRALDFLTVTHHIGASSIVLTDEVTPGIQGLATEVVRLPVTLEELVTPLLYVAPLYLYAFHVSLRRGWDPVDSRYTGIVPHKARYVRAGA